MAFKDNKLEFFDKKIIDPELGIEVMMDWEASIMEKSAGFICQNKGDILEIGFGMGICADYIQDQGVNSHTIVEIHPQIIEKLKTWSSGKSNVTIISQSWQEVTASLGRFDGIFFDDFGGEYNDISSSLLLLTKSETKMTFWNNTHTSSNPINPNAELQEISVTPDDRNGYFTNNIYYMPKLEF